MPSRITSLVWRTSTLNRRRANIQAASQRVAKPSAGGLVLGLAGSVVSGAQTAMSLKAPPAGGPRPTPTGPLGGTLPNGRAGTPITWS
jgi:hypothetical protein